MRARGRALLVVIVAVLATAAMVGHGLARAPMPVRGDPVLWTGQETSGLTYRVEARLRADGARCVAVETAMGGASGRTSSCFPRGTRTGIEGVVVARCAARAAAVGGIATHETRTVRVRPARGRHRAGAHVQVDVLDHVTFFGDVLDAQELPARLVFKDAAGHVVGRRTVPAPSRGCLREGSHSGSTEFGQL